MGLFDKIQTVPLWKKIYQTVSGYSRSVSCDIVQDIISMSSTELKEGYAIYEKYSETEFQKWEKALTEKDTVLLNFFKRLCKSLNLAPQVALPVLFNYLMFEYYGKLEDIQDLIRFDHSVLILLKDVWHFYSSERMYYIKTVRHIFDCAVKPNHPFMKEYLNYIKSLDMIDFRKSFISQFRVLINEITDESLSNSFNQSSYVNRNNREQLEFLLLIVMTMEYKEISVDEFTTMFDNFLQHNFTRQPVYFDATLFGEAKDFTLIKYAEIGFFIIALHQIGKKINFLPKTIEESLRHIQNQGDHKIVLLTWVLSRMNELDENETEAMNIYENLIRVLIDEQTFTSISKFVSSELIQSNVRSAKLIQAAIFKLLNDFLIMLNSKEVLFEDEGLHQTIVSLIEDPEIASECSSVNGGFDVIVKMTFDKFPRTFLRLTDICRVLVKHENLAGAVISKLNNLTISHTSGAQVNKRRISYFAFLAKMTEQLITNHGKVDNFGDILAGYELILEIVSQYKTNIKESELSECIKLLDQFVNCHKTTENSIPLVEMYFKIHTSLVIHQNSDIQKEFGSLKMAKHFLPKVHIEENIPEILMQCSISDSTLIQLLKKEEHKSVHNTVKTYLRLLEYCIEQDLELENIQTPGVIYMVRFVFPQHKSWRYTDSHERTEISLSCLKIMLEVLIKNSSKSNDVLKKFLFYALLKKPPMMTLFLQYFIQEKFHLQKIMLNEIDWLGGKMLRNITLSKMHLSIFLRLLSECNLKPSDAILKSKIQTVAKCAVAFITNAFSSSLANLACRLLEIISRDSSIPILAVLEMDCSQIQCLFLEKLRDPLEDDVFKITVLDFINTALLSQNGLTAAFFNALDSVEKKGTPKNVSHDSVCDFMIDYLQNIQKNPEYVTNPVQRNILRVFSTLWSTGRENLVQDIYSLHCFWPLLTEPLFHLKMRDPEVYTHIMTMTTIHIMEFRRNIHENLKGVIRDFFKNEQLITQWTTYIQSVLQIDVNNEQYNEIAKFIFAWKKFLMSIKTYYPEAITLKTVKCNLILSCLKGILCHSTRQFDNQIITDFFDLYLILIFSWTDSYNSEIRTIELLSSVLTTFVAKCRLPSFHNREVLLTLIHKTIEDCKDLLRRNPYLLNNLLKPFGYIFGVEYENLCKKHEDTRHKINAAVSWTLVARIGDSVLSMGDIKQFSLFFKYHQYLKKMLESIRILLSDRSTVPMVKMILQNLILYAKSDIAMDFLSYNYTIINDIIDNGNSILPRVTNGEFLIHLKEQWILYAMVIKLNHIILNRFGDKVFESNLIFVSVSDKIIPQMICLPEFTVDKRALDLSYETLNYLNKLLEWLKIWSIKNNESFNVITLAIKRVLNSCITTILRTEHIQFYKVNKLGKLNVAYEKPNTLIPHVVDRYLELTCVALRCLIKSNPSMVEVLSIEKPKSPCYLLVEYDFAIPKFDIPITEQLTYGRLLCSIYFLCKTLNYEFPKNDASQSSELYSKKKLLENHKDKNLGDIFGKLTLLDEDYIGFIEYPKGVDNVLQPTKLKAFLHYAEQGNSEPWLKEICKNKVKTTLEYLMTFVAVQAFFQVHTLHKPQLHYFKRELYSELQFFNEFAKKLATDEFSKLSLKRISDPQNTDVINRVATAMLGANNNLDQISNKFYLLAISKWFQNICQLS